MNGRKLFGIDGSCWEQTKVHGNEQMFLGTVRTCQEPSEFVGNRRKRWKESSQTMDGKGPPPFLRGWGLKLIVIFFSHFAQRFVVLLAHSSPAFSCIIDFVVFSLLNSFVSCLRELARFVFLGELARFAFLGELRSGWQLREYLSRGVRLTVGRYTTGTWRRRGASIERVA